MKTKITASDALELPWDVKAKLIRDVPVMCATHHDHCFKTFFNTLLKQESGVFAPYIVDDWFARYEFQLRGSLHTHMLVWLKDAPFITEDIISVMDCIDFINEFITCERPTTGNLVDLIQYQRVPCFLL